MNKLEVVQQCLQSCNELPGIVCENIANITNIEIRSFDVSYIEFLDEQINLNARGAEWTNRLKSRRENLAVFVGVKLLNASLYINGREFSFKIEPNERRVIHWEES